MLPPHHLLKLYYWFLFFLFLRQLYHINLPLFQNLIDSLRCFLVFSYLFLPSTTYHTSPLFSLSVLILVEFHCISPSIFIELWFLPFVLLLHLLLIFYISKAPLLWPINLCSNWIFYHYSVFVPIFHP